ncbi:MAG: hydrogenase expression/formation protein HypE [Ignavibacteria bacterium]|nr:hydrogenase expression/formation protein HypE [Ignavibacteria bacterium]
MTTGKEKTEALNLTAGLACPIPISDYPRVLLAHGGGGKLSQQIIQKMIVPQFKNDLLDQLHDGAVFTLDGVRLAFSTDSYVVNPIFFPGGDIGELAVNGTVNDLAMCGARPLFLSAAFIIEEGFPMDDLWRVILSMQSAATKAGVKLVTGDTKVVDRGKGDKIFINTSGIGVVDSGIQIGSRNARVGDAIIISGPIAVHGIAIMSVREGLEFESQIESDTAALNHLVMSMVAASKNIHVLRDPTRGGVASSLNEIAESSRVGIKIDEEKIPITEPVRGACEILGLDPLYVANEGKLIAFVSPSDVESVLSAMRQNPLGKESAVIGEVVGDHPGTVVMRTSIGGSRVVDMLSGEQLPRIC